MEFDIEHLEYLSKLMFSDEEKQTFEANFSNVLDFVSEIASVELPEDLEKDTPVSLSSLREDKAVTSISREEILANAPKQKDGCFQTPLVVE